MDIRKYFSLLPEQKPESIKLAEKIPIKAKSRVSNENGNGLSKERQLSLSPKETQCKKYKKSSLLLPFSSDESDGESPFPRELKKKMKTKNRKAIISSDEEEGELLSASTFRPLDHPKPLNAPSRNGSKIALKKTLLFEGDNAENSQSRDAISHQSGVKRRTARKIILPDHEPMLEVFSKKRKVGQREHVAVKHEVVEVIEKSKSKAVKRSKLSSNTISPQLMNSINNDTYVDCKLSSEETYKSPQKTTFKGAQKILEKTAKRPTLENLIVLPSKNVSGRKIQNYDVKKPAVKEVEKKPVRRLIESTNNLPWVDKYKPMQVKQLVGQHTEKSSYNKLLKWLKDWSKHNLGAGALQKKARPSPFQAQSDGTSFKAALLSGPPGIGKTTCAVMACKELDLRYLETNASDARNKKTIEAHVAGLLDNRQINNYFSGETKSALSKVKGVDQVLIMDEVDGMSGNQDRAGIAELILMIKRSKVPIICICNDRQSQKIRSLANYCFDLRFQRPRAEQIKGRLMTIVTQERINITKEVLDDIIEASNHDIRQCVHSLQLLASGGKFTSKFQKKDVSVNMFEAARKLLSRETNLAKKQEMFFSDYSIMPLFVQENYVYVREPKIGNAQHIRSIRQAADLIAFGDIINRQIRSSGSWNLLVDQSMFSCVLPALVMDGHLNNQLQFPAWFGKYSNANKRQRLMRQLSNHTHRKISGSDCALVMDYLPVLRDRLYRPLVEKDVGGVKVVVEIYKAYDLVKDDLEAINELGIWPIANKANKDISQSVSTKAKSTLTRTLNKEHRLLPFSQSAPVKGRKQSSTGEGVILELDEEGHEIVVGGGEEDDDEIINDE